MSSFHSSVLIAKLKELLPNLQVDIDSRNIYPGSLEGQRMGLFLGNEHVCNIERGDVPEFNCYGEYAKAMMLIHPSERRPSDVTQQIMTMPEGSTITLFIEANKNLGRKTLDEIKVGTMPCIAQRLIGTDPATGEAIHCILLRIYYRWMDLPHAVDRVGWRQLFEEIINKTGIKKEDIEKKFDVVLTGRTDGESIREIAAKKGSIQ